MLTLDKTPLVSVVVPIYNVADYLSECIDSILNQTYPLIEVILVDDGSTDNSPVICDNYVSKNKNISVIHKSNGGLSSARNAGLEKATGDYITFVDSDDWLNCNMIERCMSLIKQYDADVCCVSFNKAYSDGHFIQNKTLQDSPICYNKIDALAKYLFNTNLTVCVWGKVWKKSLWDNVKCPDGFLHEDQFTTFKLIDAAGKIVFDPEPLYYYRQREGSIGHSSFSERSYDLLKGVDLQYEYIANRYPEIEKQIGAACSFWYCVFVNMMLRSGHQDSIAVRHCRSFVRKHILDILKIRDYPVIRKLQLLLFAYSLTAYRIMYTRMV